MYLETACSTGMIIYLLDTFRVVDFPAPGLKVGVETRERGKRGKTPSFFVAA
jgi:hypothetical protein